MTKILLVDDSKFLRLATERALERAGYDVTSATDGEQALQMARTFCPDLILLDMLLPKLPGPEVLKALKKDPKTADIPVVVFTGVSRKNASRPQRDGAYGYLEKAGLGLDKGFDSFLAAVADIIQQLPVKKRVISSETRKKQGTTAESGSNPPKKVLSARQANRG